MASFKQQMKFGLLRYPSIFPDPLNVSIHLFAIIGNGYDWVDGELVDCYEPEKTDEPLTMKYSDAIEDSELDKEMKALDSMAGFYIERKLKDEATLARMKFIEDNIDQILETGPNTQFFGSSTSYYYKKGICTKYAKAFYFPDNIKEDWAKALYKFLEQWLYALISEYGPDIHRKEVLTKWQIRGYKVLNYCLKKLGYENGPVVDGDRLLLWPKNIVEAREDIIEARSQLHPYAHNGETYAEHAAKMRECFKSIFPEKTN